MSHCLGQVNIGTGMAFAAVGIIGFVGHDYASGTLFLIPDGALPLAAPRTPLDGLYLPRRGSA